VWAACQDHEMIMSLPGSFLAELVDGLEKTHQKGIRYPIPVDVRHAPTFPGQLKDATSRTAKT